MAYDYSNYSTWTPSLQLGGSSSGLTYTTQYGYYSLQGNVVVAQYYIVINALGSSTGNATITGLPYTCVSAGDFYNGNIALSGVTFSTNYFVAGHVVLASTNYITLIQTGSNIPITNIVNTNLANGITLQGEIFYFI